eukprot:PhF_6_TR34126/c0_g1_i1/m.49815/K00285/dadA; D-amino-acid dehydrogenase
MRKKNTVVDHSLKDIVVIGAGIVGLSTAYALAFNGHKVTVFDRNPEIAQECSLWNGSLITPALTYPWSNPGALKYLPGALLHSPESSVHISPRALLSPRFWSFVRRFGHNCAKQAVKDNFIASHRLAQFSYNVMMDDWGFDETLRPKGSKGTLQLYTTKEGQIADWDKYVTGTKSIASPDLYQKVDEKKLFELEPLLLRNTSRKYGIYTPNDTSGDINDVCQQLYQKCLKANVKFRFRCNPTIDYSNGFIRSVNDLNSVKALIMCNGNSSHIQARRSSDSLGMYPVKGYLHDLPLADGKRMTTSIGDEKLKVYVVPVENGKYARVSGMADFDSFAFDATTMLNEQDHPQGKYVQRRGKKLLARALSLFPPGTFDLANSRTRCCLRPQTCDDLPVIGRSVMIGNMFYNTGHGHLGLTRAAGSAILVRDMIEGKTSEINPAPYLPDRMHNYKKEEIEEVRRTKDRPFVTTPPYGTVHTPTGEVCFTGRAEDYDKFLQYREWYRLQRMTQDTQKIVDIDPDGWKTAESSKDKKGRGDFMANLFRKPPS